MKRFFNFRPIVLILLAFVVGILSGLAYLNGYSWVLWLLVGLCFLGGVLFAVFKKWTQFFSLIIALIVIFAGYFDFNINFKKFTKDLYADTACTVSGKLTDYYADYGDCALVIVKNPTIYSDGKVESFKTKDVGVWIYFSEELTIDTLKNGVGSFIDFECLLNNAPIFSDDINTFYVKNDIYFVAKNVKRVQITDGIASFDENARLFIKKTLTKNMSAETAGVAIALMLGDKSALSNDLQNGYRTMGISHVFAVSGLHIGFIYSFIGFFIFKLRISKWKAVPLTFLPMLFYAWLCGFSASVVRALIMTSCSLLFQAIGVKSDGLNSIAFSAIIILLISPLYLFDAGFLMSFAAVVGINCVSREILRKYSTENKIFGFFINTLAISLGASVGVMAVVAHFYGEITLWGFLFNIVITPFISIVFVLLLIGLIPFLNFVLVLPKYFFIFTNFLATKFTSIEFGSFEVKSFGIALIFLFVAMFVFGGYFNFSKKLKLIVLSVLMGIFCLSGILIIAPKQTSFAVECFDANSNYCYVVTDTQNNAYVVSDFKNAYESRQIADFCVDNHIKNIYILILNYDNTKVENVKILLEYNINIQRVYTPLSAVDYEKDVFFKVNDIQKFTLIGGSKIDFNELSLTCISDGVNHAWFLNSDKAKMLFCGDSSTDGFVNMCKNFVSQVDVVFISHDERYVLERTKCTAVVTTNYSEDANIFGLKYLGRLTIKFADDIITIIP